MRVRSLGALVAIPLLFSSVACGDDDKKDDDASSESGTGFAAKCDDVLKPADPAAALPAGIPGFDGATFNQVETQGATKRYFAYAPGTDLVAVRDAVKANFDKANVEVTGTDQEEGTEAEFEFKTSDGKEGSVQVIPLCKDTVRIRWRVGPK